MSSKYWRVRVRWKHMLCKWDSRSKKNVIIDKYSYGSLFLRLKAIVKGSQKLFLSHSLIRTHVALIFFFIFICVRHVTLIVHYSLCIYENVRHRTDCEAMNAETKLHFMSIFVNIFFYINSCEGLFRIFVKGKLIFFLMMTLKYFFCVYLVI